MKTIFLSFCILSIHLFIYLLWTEKLSPTKIPLLKSNPQCDGTRRRLGHKGGALMNGIMVLIKETPPPKKRDPRELPPGPPPTEGQQQENYQEPGRGSSLVAEFSYALILDI